MEVTQVYFVRHAQSDHRIQDEVVRPLTAKGHKDSLTVTAALKHLGIAAIYSSPYLRTVDTVKDLAEALNQPIVTVDDFRERKVGSWVDDFKEFSRRQWEDLTFKQEGGESLAEVQARNIAALQEVLGKHKGNKVVVGTHGTALSTIIHYYNKPFGYEDFWRIIDWMPYIVRFDFVGDRMVGMEEIPLAGMGIE